MNNEEIKVKANYCLNCKIKPCSLKGCPLGNNIPEFIKAVKEEKYEEAYKILSETTVLQGVCRKNLPTSKTMSRFMCKRNKRRASVNRRIRSICF